VAADERGERRLGAAHVVPRLEGIDRVGGDELAGGVDHRDLDARAHARIEAHRRARAGRRGEQQILEVAGEDTDRLLLRPLAELAVEVEHHREAELRAPGPTGDFAEPEVARATAGDAEGSGDHRLDLRQAALRLGRDVEREEALVGAAHHRERAVARHLRPALGVGEVVRELRALLLLALHDPRRQQRLALQEGAQATEKVGVSASRSVRMSRAPESASFASGTSSER
jgi:hypothetical protein